MVWKLTFWLPFLVLLPPCAGDCDPENLTDSRLNQMPEHTTQKSFPNGAVHTYKCMHGYRPFNDRRNATCRGTVWELDNARPLGCHGASCGAPGGRNGIDHGTFRSHVFTFPNKVAFDCERGYRLHSHDNQPVDSDYGIYCQSDGLWSEPPPKCLVVVCPQPAQVVHGDVDTSEGLNFRAVVHYSCNRLYRLVGPPSRQCQDNATWSGAEPTCEEVKCPTPVNPPGGVVVVTSMSVGANVTYRCLADGSTLVARCLPQGVWSRDAPRCPPVVPTQTSTGTPTTTTTTAAVTSPRIPTQTSTGTPTTTATTAPVTSPPFEPTKETTGDPPTVGEGSGMLALFSVLLVLSVAAMAGAILLLRFYCKAEASRGSDT
ncbi:sushi, von Willebrand factor type A, EGF and pentraxin domain-containing protein 1 [Ixodes scapularis]